MEDFFWNFDCPAGVQQLMTTEQKVDKQNKKLTANG